MSNASQLNIGSGSGQNHFKLQIGVTGAGAQTEQTQAQIVAGYSNNPQFLEVPSRNAVQFSVRADGPVSGSTYPRCELREMNTDGTTVMAFNASTGVHWCRARIRIGTLGPVRPHCTFFQMHDAGTVDEVVSLSSQVNSTTGDNELRLRLWDSATGLPKLIVGCGTGDTYDFMFSINNGAWAFYWQDLSVPIYDSNDYAADGFVNTFSNVAEMYFKLGCYPQTNVTYDAPTTYISSEVSYLSHWHTGWPTPNAITLPKTAQFSPFFG